MTKSKERLEMGDGVVQSQPRSVCSFTRSFVETVQASEFHSIDSYAGYIDANFFINTHTQQLQFPLSTTQNTKL